MNFGHSTFYFVAPVLHSDRLACPCPVYDVTKRQTFEGLKDIWMKEVEMYSTIDCAIKMVVANKVDLETMREVSTEEGAVFAKENGCLFVETSAKADTAVAQAFQELILKIMETPELLRDSSGGLKLGGTQSAATASSCSCSVI